MVLNILCHMTLYCRLYFSIDAIGSTQLGRYVNDSPIKYANCRPKPVLVDGQPHLVLFACDNIEEGTELRYDYGTGINLQWRKVSRQLHVRNMLSFNSLPRCNQCCYCEL